MMKNKYIGTLLFLGTFLFTVFIQSLESNREEKQAFYAISSLRFYLDKVISPIKENDEEEISFDAQDVAFLWSLTMDTKCSDQINKAQCYYYESFEKNDGQSGMMLSKAKEILDEVWEQLNNEYFCEGASSLSHSHCLLNQPRYSNRNFAHAFVDIQLSDEEGDKASKYFLPEDHWLKGKLDKIFSHLDVLGNKTNFNEAGFITIVRRTSGMRVAGHPLLPGYLIKAYLNSNPKKINQDWTWPINRCKGAENIRNLIEKEHLRFFTVPDKWIYLLPTQWLSNPNEQPSVLVVTDMNLVSREDSEKAWKEANQKVLQELFCILSHGFGSCYLPYNIPYTKNGTYACVDTAYPYRQHKYDKVRRFLSSEMRTYWDKLVKKGGNL